MEPCEPLPSLIRPDNIHLNLLFMATRPKTSPNNSQDQFEYQFFLHRCYDHDQLIQHLVALLDYTPRSPVRLHTS